ncbi:MAG: isocitrate lyase/PEP mutase family protein [Hyphomonadaceae bacterium]
MRALLKGDDLVISPGVYDGYSARLVEKAGFKTACTTGAGLSNTLFGQPDAGIMGLSDNVNACRHIARSIDIPLMADADTGYGNPVSVHHTVRYFEEAGVVGINIEDQVSPKRCGHMAGKDVIPIEEMTKKVEAACAARRDDNFIVLARTDAIAVEGIEGAIRRARVYAAAGADLIFADATHSEEQIKKLVDSVPVPVSVNMGFGIRSRPTTPLIPFAKLKEIGVKRVTLPRMLPAAAIMAMQNALSILKETVESGGTADRPDLLVGIDDIMALMDYPSLRALEAQYLNTDDHEERYGAIQNKPI